MKLRIFQSLSGDCILLESAGGKRILCDGGMPGAMDRIVLKHLEKLGNAGEVIDLLYISHIDRDHIGGVRKLLDAAAKWAAHDFHEARGEDFAPPKVRRPPKIRALWHNAFRDQVDDNDGRIEDLLAAAAPVLLATQTGPLFELGLEVENIALGVDDAIFVSKAVGPDILDIPVNKLPGAGGPAKLLMARPGQQPVKIGDLRIQIVGPTPKQLKQLRDGWNHWLENRQDKLQEVNDAIRKLIDEFSTSEQPRAFSAADWEAFSRDWEGQPSFKNVTVPNIASLVLLVREGDRTVLLTGDAQHDLLLEHLEAGGCMPEGYLHLDVLKVQHHGSENNMSPEFAHKVSADHYVFCGNGLHENPDLRVIDEVAASRMSTDPNIRALAPEAAGNRKFHFWFSTSEDTNDAGAGAVAHFEGVVAAAKALRSQSQGRLVLHFNDGDAATLNLP